MARPRIRWIRRQVDNLRNAVRQFNAAVTRMERSGKYDMVPHRVDVQQEMNRIETRDQLRQRLVELGRILKKNRPDAQDVVQAPDGSRVPRYLVTETRNAKRSVNRQRLRLRAELYPDWDNMKPWEQGAARSDRNIEPLHENYWTSDDLAYLWSQKYYTDRDYLRNYLDTLIDMAVWEEYLPELEPIIQRLLRKPGALRRIFEEQHDETEIYYIYPFSKNDLTPFERRQANVVRFWSEQAQRFDKWPNASDAPKGGFVKVDVVGEHKRGMKL